MEKGRQQEFVSWLFAGLLVVLFAALGVLQYRWIGEVSQAERERLRSGLQTSLHRLSRDFNNEITSACAALMPGYRQVEELGREAAYSARFLRWRDSSRYPGLFRRAGIAVLDGTGIRLLMLDPDAGTYAESEWPHQWAALKENFAARLREPFGRGFPQQPAGAWILIPLMRLGRPPATPAQPPGPLAPPRLPPELEWLILELDTGCVSGELLPDLLERHLADRGRQEYQVEVIAVNDSARKPIYRTGGAPPIQENKADGTIRLFEVQYDQILRRMVPPRFRDGKAARADIAPRPPAAGGDRGRWLMLVRHEAGSIDAVVERARMLNLCVATGVLLLVVGAIAALVRFTIRSRRLAALQMEFVAGVSHELRTPLSVIRTAAHNLGQGVVKDARQIQRYGVLIRDEAERLTHIVEQVLQFAGAKAGRAIGGREPLPVETVVDGAVEATASAITESRCTLEKQIEAGLPPLLADPLALKHALQNLLNNAVKYGSDGGWIGISAAAAELDGKQAVEIRVKDRGAGIDPDEAAHIFDPFYRGQRAINDQIHGTGLGLSLVKRIVEAHDGTVEVKSRPGGGTEFILRIPVAPEEQRNEFAYSAG